MVDLYDFSKRLKKSINNINKLQELIRDLQDEILNLVDEKADLRNFLVSDELFRISFVVAIGEADFGQKLINNFLRDMAGYPQFGDDIFIHKIVDVLTDNSPVIVQRNGRSFTIEIDMESAAGTLDDYAAGVEYVRSVLEEEKPRKRKYNPINASHYWRWIYGNGPHGELYSKTMNLRLEAFGDLAPFWYFIENGVPQELSSDKGGFPTPASSPAMRTVEKSRQEFTVEFENFWDREIGLREERTVESIDEIEYTLSKLYDLLDKAQKALALLIGGGGGPTEYEIVENLLKKQLDKSKYGKKADPEKAAQLIRQLIEGEEIPDRIRLGGGARPRTIELQRQVDEALSRD